MLEISEKFKILANWILLCLRIIWINKFSYFLVYSWLDLLIWLGYKQDLTQDDLYDAPEEVQSQYLLKIFSR